MSLVKRSLWLAIAGVMLTAANPGVANPKDEIKVEQIKEVPSEIKSMLPRALTNSPTLSAVFFFEPGTNTNAQSVAAGQRFDMVVYLNMHATSNINLPVTTFRLDIASLGSGQVRVIPIVVGTAPDEKYWDVAPSSPVTIQNGFVGVRVRNLKVLANAKQPPDGDITKPFAPVRFPDHVIMFVQHGDVVLAPTLRIAKP